MLIYKPPQENIDRFWFSLLVKPIDKKSFSDHLLKNRSMHDSKTASDISLSSTAGKYFFSKIKLSDNGQLFIFLLQLFKLSGRKST